MDFFLLLNVGKRELSRKCDYTDQIGMLSLDTNTLSIYRPESGHETRQLLYYYIVVECQSSSQMQTIHLHETILPHWAIPTPPFPVGKRTTESKRECPESFPRKHIVWLVAHAPQHLRISPPSRKRQSYTNDRWQRCPREKRVLRQ